MTKEGRQLNKERFKELIESKAGLNSYERHALTKCLTDEALASEVEYCLSQCSFDRHSFPSTYNEAIFKLFVPEMIKRLKGL